MELRVSGAVTPVRASSYLSVSRSRLLALSASAAFMLFPGDVARAQEAPAEENAQNSNTAGTNGEAGAGAAGPDPEGTPNDAANGAATEGSLPPVVIEQQADPEPIAPVVEAEPDPEPTPRSDYHEHAPSEPDPAPGSSSLITDFHCEIAWFCIAFLDLPQYAFRSA
ncbi:MAG: hypothetical protein A49_06150 [Methyloceanibacter sp.]|nr:MAG: hypothetical protein A49_06150 [Methyloceanibacter sp.]